MVVLSDTEQLAAPVEARLLGSLQFEVMDHMGQVNKATVRQVMEAILRTRPVAYTTIMTTMVTLANKRLLSREKMKNCYLYRVSMSREEFLRETSKRKVQALLEDFGTLAVTVFRAEIGMVSDDGRV